MYMQFISSQKINLSFFVDEFGGTRLGELIFFTAQGNSGAFCGDLGKARLLVNV